MGTRERENFKRAAIESVRVEPAMEGAIGCGILSIRLWNNQGRRKNQPRLGTIHHDYSGSRSALIPLFHKTAWFSRLTVEAIE